jgi:endonuclease G
MKQYLYRIAVINVFAILAVFASCSGNDNPVLSDEVIFSGPVEIPELRNGVNDIFTSHSTTYGGQKLETFSLEYDCSKKHARWIAFRFDNRSGKTTTGRSEEPFQPDPSIDVQYQRVQADFGRKGYDRGHICASADRLYSEEANIQTFYYTNMSPQKNDFNIGMWRELEAKVQIWGRSNTFRDTLYVVKGGTIDKEDQILTFIDNDRSKPVPKYYFMALLCKKGNGFKAIGFWLEHKSYSLPYSLAPYAVTIDHLEELTGLNFFHHLPDKLENSVESQLSLTAWPSLN